MPQSYELHKLPRNELTQIKKNFRRVTFCCYVAFLFDWFTVWYYARHKQVELLVTNGSQALERTAFNGKPNSFMKALGKKPLVKFDVGVLSYETPVSIGLCLS